MTCQFTADLLVNLLLTSLVMACPLSSVAADTARPLIGVIRWDGQSGFDAKQVGCEEEIALGSSQWQYRLPFYAQKPTGDSCRLRRAITQEVIDREIAYAKEGGVDYWAFCWYANEYYLSTARHLYEKSKHKEDVKWCAIISNGFFQPDVDYLVRQMREANYQKVAGGRPLLYTFGCTKPEIITNLREHCKSQGVATPYVVVMEWSGQTTAALCDKIGGDAISAYTSFTRGDTEVAYQAFAAAEQASWESWAKTGRKVIPWATVGWDPRPRIQMIPKYDFAPLGYASSHSMSTGSEYADQLRACLRWTVDHPSICEANSILCYSWNEFSEGGSICPKLSGGREHLDALKQVSHAPLSSW
jgi:hypothetical protein